MKNYPTRRRFDSSGDDFFSLGLRRLGYARSDDVSRNLPSTVLYELRRDRGVRIVRLVRAGKDPPSKSERLERTRHFHIDSTRSPQRGMADRETSCRWSLSSGRGILFLPSTIESALKRNKNTEARRNSIPNATPRVYHHDVYIEISYIP